MLIQLSHDEKLSRILSSAITVCFLAVAVDIGMPYEFSLIPPILSCCALAYYILLKRTLPLIVFALVAFAFIVAFFSLINIDVIKQAFFFFMVAFGALCQKHCSKEDLTRSVLTILAIYISIGIFELLIPNVSTLKSLILTRSTMPEGTRGVASLAQEPSFFALVVFSSWIILMASGNFSLRKVDLIAFLAVLALMLTKSGMSILVFPMIFIAFKQSIFSFSLVTSTLLLLLFSQLTRAKIFLELLINLNYSVLDESQSGRLFYIIKDLNTIAARYFVPYWPGSYEYASSTMTSLSHDIETLGYNPDMPGSLLLYFFVEYGIIAILVVTVTSYKFIKKNVNTLRSLIFTLCIVFVSIQMISLMFAPTALATGFLFGWTWQKRDFNIRFKKVKSSSLLTAESALVKRLT